MNFVGATKTFRGRAAMALARLASAPALRGAKHPGGGAGHVWVDENDQRLVIAVQGEGFDVIVGQHQMYQFSVSSKLAGKIAWWLVRWWICCAWFGLRFKVWNWALGALYDEESFREP